MARSFFFCGRGPARQDLPSVRPGMNGRRGNRRIGAAAPRRSDAGGTAFPA